jgi:hypothetical protein
VGDGDGERDGVELRVCVEDGVLDGVGLALMHDGFTSPVQVQLPSAPLLVRTPPLPVAGAVHEKAYEVAPAIGAAGTTAVFAKAASGGCESATIAADDSVRLYMRSSASAPAKRLPPFIVRSLLQPTRSVEAARAGSVMAAASWKASAPSRKAESW